MGSTNLQRKNNSENKGAIACGIMTVQDKLVVGVGVVITHGKLCHTNPRQATLHCLVSKIDG
jgi:hypothetical protein